MNLAPSPDQTEIAASTAGFLAKELPISRVRELAADPRSAVIDEETWSRCADLGWLALSLPEEQGGVGLGLPEEVMLFRELGRGLAPGPFRSSVLGARVAALAGETSLAEEIASGNRRVGMDLGGVAIDARPGDLLLRVEENGGTLSVVVDAEPTPGVDPCTRFSRVTTTGTVVQIEGPALMDRARVLAAAELLGIIEAICDMSAAYAQTRTQFGKAIGSFQAVKHRCADMAIASYATVGQVFQAALLVEAGAPDAAFHASSAYVLAVNGARTSAADNIQNHGGIGYTWEHDAHLYLKRAFLLERLLGPQRNSYRAILAPERHEF
ncbi:acyl-CoA dehydrogenase family protein [Nocardioides sp. WS12]|uniref:acyl-CoA dehydrogenase family protein n=1 Tax=Nocardioides sp. WS12 TaxID=2486272 RepID=UPI0015F9A33B|nr:acyl-CoA dehydrogenase family protein [Nocardioides sp. WS12]